MKSNICISWLLQFVNETSRLVGTRVSIDRVVWQRPRCREARHALWKLATYQRFYTSRDADVASLRYYAIFRI